MRLLLSAILLFSITFTALGNNDLPSDLPDITLDLNHLSPDWWKNINELSAQDKRQFLSLIQVAIKKTIQNPVKEIEDDNLPLIFKLIETLSEQYSLPELQNNNEKVAATQTLEGWLTLFTQTNQIAQDVALMRVELERAKSVHRERASAISKLLVEYTLLDELSDERIKHAIKVIRLQLEQLLTNENQRRLKIHIQNGDLAYQAQKKQIALAVMDFIPSPKQQAIRIKQHAELLIEIAQINKALYQLGLDRLGESGSIMPIKIMADDLVHSANLVSETSKLTVLELEIALEKAITGEPLPSLAPQEIQWKELQSQKNKLNKQFDELFQRLDMNELNLSAEQRINIWGSLRKVRQYFHDIELRGHEITLLLSAYNTIGGDQLSTGRQVLLQIKDWLSTSFNLAISIFQYPLFSINETPVTLISLIWVLAVIGIANLISTYSRNALTQFGENNHYVSEASMFTIGRMIHYVIILMAMLIGFSTLGIDLSQFALVAGAFSVGIGFGLQSIFNNFISGLILLFERPLKVGDLIELESGVRGRIKSVNVRSTQVTTWDNIDILVPNSEFISGRVTNYTFNDDLRRQHIPFGVAYGTDKNLVMQAVTEAALRVPQTLTNKEHRPDVWLVSFGESCLEYELVVWIRGNKWGKRDNPHAIYLWEIETSLAQYGLAIPFPQRDLHLKTINNELLDKILGGKKDTP
jgi:small-conductance mechanosensitive channel